MSARSGRSTCQPANSQPCSQAQRIPSCRSSYLALCRSLLTCTLAMASATAIATADALLDAWASHGQLAHSAKALETSDDTASWAEDWEEADALAVHWLSLRAPLPGSRAPRAPSRQPNSSRAAGRRPAIAVGADESVQMSLRAFDADGAAPQAMQGGRKGGRPCMQLKASALLVSTLRAAVVIIHHALELLCQSRPCLAPGKLE